MIDGKFKMSAVFTFGIKGVIKDKIFNFSKGRFSVIGSLIDMIFGVSSEAYARLLKSIPSQFFSRYRKSYNNLNVKNCLKLNGH